MKILPIVVLAAAMLFASNEVTYEEYIYVGGQMTRVNSGSVMSQSGGSSGSDQGGYGSDGGNSEGTSNQNGSTNKSVSFGLQQAFNYGGWTGSDAISPTGFGANFGVKVQIPISKNFSFIPGLEFNMLTGSETYEDYYYDGYDIEVSDCDLTLPLDFRIMFGRRFFLETGVAFSLNIFTKVDVTDNYYGDTYSESEIFQTKKLAVDAGFGFVIIKGFELFIKSRIDMTASRDAENYQVMFGASYFFR